MSTKYYLVDMFTICVHGMDMNYERTHSDVEKVSAKELGYGT